MARWGRAVSTVVVALAAALATATARADESSPSRPAGAATYPSGVGTVAAATRPEGSLHVGAAIGQETDRTYLSFEVTGLPDDAEVDGVTVTIPVDTEAGTSAPETAVILGCAVPGGVDPEATEAPEVDCDGAPEATFTGGGAPTFTLELPAPVGDTVDVALVPGGGDTWHVGFDDADGDAPPTVVASYDVPVAATTTTTRAAAPRPESAEPAAFPTGGVPLALPSLTTPPPAAAGRVVADQAQLVPPPVTTASTDGGGFRYAAVFALPLALLVLVGLIGDGLTKPVRLREERA